MESQEYEKIIKLIQGKTTIENQGKYEKYEEKFGKLYKKNKEGKTLKVLKKDEIDTVL